jgi:hypothetical protein
MAKGKGVAVVVGVLALAGLGLGAWLLLRRPGENGRVVDAPRAGTPASPGRESGRSPGDLGVSVTDLLRTTSPELGAGDALRKLMANVAAGVRESKGLEIASRVESSSGKSLLVLETPMVNEALTSSSSNKQVLMKNPITGKMETTRQVFRQSLRVPGIKTAQLGASFSRFPR